MRRLRPLLLVLVSISVWSAGCAAEEVPVAAPAQIDLSGTEVDVYHSPGCSCCLGWVAYVEGLGAEVTLTEVADMGAFKTRAGVPTEAGSCHTAVVDGYVVEGHVPVEAIEALRQTAPSIRGIALPGMPADSPGMGGTPADWASQPVQAIGHDGALTPFEF